MQNTKLAVILNSVLLVSLSTHAASENTSRIINGTQAVKGDWPFMTALIIKGTEAYKGQFCGASFLGGRYVLTASHCVAETSPDDIDVSVGIYNLRNESSEGQRVSVQAIYMHDDYNAQLINNDIAIIELSQEITAPSIELATNDLVNTLETGNPDLTVMGWGNTSTTENIYPDILYQVDVPYVDRSTCQNVGGDYSTVGDDAICAGYAEGGKDSCQGDSGGPLLYNDNGTYKQVGIVSWGIGCAQPNAYGVYTNVGYFNQQGWIAEMTDGVSYTQNKYIKDSEEEQVTLQFPIRNYSTESFDITNISLPAGFTLTENTCTSTLEQNDSCQLTARVDMATASTSPTSFSSTSTTSDGTTTTVETKISTITVTTDHSQSPELKMNTTFITTKTSSIATATKSSGGASLGLGLLAVFAYMSRRKRA